MGLVFWGEVVYLRDRKRGQATFLGTQRRKVASPLKERNVSDGASGVQHVAVGERGERRQVRGPVAGDRGQERRGLPSQPDGDGSGRRLGRRVRSREAVLRADEERLQPHLVFDQGGLPQGGKGAIAGQGRERGETPGTETEDLNDCCLEHGELEVLGRVLLDVRQQSFHLGQHLVGALIKLVLDDQLAEGAVATLDPPDQCFTLGGDAVQALVQRRSEEHTSELQSQSNLVCRLLLEKKKTVIWPVSTSI